MADSQDTGAMFNRMAEFLQQTTTVWDERTKKVSDLEKENAELHAKITILTDTLAEHEKDREGLIREAHRWLVVRDEAVTARDEAIVARDEAFLARDAAIAEAATRAESVEEALNTMELAKAAMHAQKEEKDAAISALQADVRTSNEQREAAAHVHQQQTDKATVDIERLTSELRQCREENARFQQEHAQMAGRCSALSTPPAYHQMSPERCAEFDAMPHCDLTRLSIPRLSLTRRKISVVFGGSYVPVVVTLSDSRTQLSKDLGISQLVCPRIDGNPWCPTAPGTNGYLFIGMPGTPEKFVEPLRCILWVGRKLRQRGNDCVYECYGEYELVRTTELNGDEWSILSEESKEKYVEWTVKHYENKEPGPFTPETARAAYDMGKLRVPCVKAQYKDFPPDLLGALKSLNTKDYVPPNPSTPSLRTKRKAPQASTSPATPSNDTRARTSITSPSAFARSNALFDSPTSSAKRQKTAQCVADLPSMVDEDCYIELD